MKPNEKQINSFRDLKDLFFELEGVTDLYTPEVNMRITGHCDKAQTEGKITDAEYEMYEKALQDILFVVRQNQ